MMVMILNVIVGDPVVRLLIFDSEYVDSSPLCIRIEETNRSIFDMCFSATRCVNGYQVAHGT